MGLFNYLKSLVGIVTHNEIKEVLDITQSAISVTQEQVLVLEDSKTGLPAITSGFGQLGKILLKNTKHKTVYGLVNEAVVNAVVNLNYIEKELSKVKGDVSLKELTIREATLFTDLNNYSFFSDYTSAVLREITTIIMKDGGAPLPKDMLDNKENRKFLTDNILNYVNMLETIGLSQLDYKKLVKSLPETVVHSEDEEEMLRGSNVKGLSHPGMKEFYNSPFHGLAKFLADLSAARYHKLKSDLRELELYMAILDANEKGLNTTVLEKELALTQSRIDELAYKISKEEE